MNHLPSARVCFRALLVALGMSVLIRDWRAESSPTRDDDALDRHLAKLGVKPWRQQDIQGTGVKIAILDSGFRRYRDCLGRSLPDSVAVKSFRRDGRLEARDSAHGTACAEVIHALAPKAELIFANWEPDDAASFLDAARWCRAQGASIASCSVVIPAWSDGEGGGEVHRELARVFGDGSKSGDMLAVAAAGNLASRHWSGRFRNDGQGGHVWTNGKSENRLKPWSSERVSVELLAGPRGRFTLEVLDATSGDVAGEVQTYQGSDRFAQAIRFLPRSGHSYVVRVSTKDPLSESFHVVALGAWLEQFTSSGSIMFPGDGAEWFTIGAIDSDGKRSLYSSCGPNSPLPKPDLVAPVPFPLSRRDRPLSGTSAAAPQAAGLAALIWSRYPHWTASKVREALCSSAVDLGPPGHDFEAGFGRLALPPLRQSDSR